MHCSSPPWVKGVQILTLLLNLDIVCHTCSSQILLMCQSGPVSQSVAVDSDGVVLLYTHSYSVFDSILKVSFCFIFEDRETGDCTGLALYLFHQYNLRTLYILTYQYCHTFHRHILCTCTCRVCVLVHDAVPLALIW